MLRLFRKGEPCNISQCTLEKYLNDLKYFSLNCIRQKSYYQVLGLDSTASAKDIKAAYYKLCLQFHPDKNDGSQDSVAKFREITEAYEVLSNPEKKRTYDQRGAFKSSYSGNYGQNEYYRRSFYQRKYQQYPFSGKTKDFDYDEHFKQHYEYEKQRQADFEYFKRRWEAEMRRRNARYEGYYSEWFKRTEQPREESSKKEYDHKQENFEEAQKEYSRRFYYQRQRPFLYLVPVWVLFLMIPLWSEFLDPEEISKRNPCIMRLKMRLNMMNSLTVEFKW